jgi:Tfp pilus assembly protein PilO
MGTGRSAPWVIAATFGSLVILALGWFLAISPTLSAAADSRTQAEDESSRNSVLQLQITKLAQQFTHLDEYKANLAALREQIPEQSDLTSINAGMSALASSSGVTITSVNPTTPVAFSVAQSAGTTAKPATTDSAGSTAAGTTGAAGATAGTTTSTVPKGFYAVPLSITIVGTYDQATAFLSSFQTGPGRIFLATAINAVGQQPGGAAGGRPALAAGDLELTITGYAYVMVPSVAAPAATTPPSTAPTLPTPSGQKNPFQPIS